MKIKKTCKLLLANILVISALNSCNDVNLSNISKDVELAPTLVVPIGYAEITAKQIVDNSQTGEFTVEGDNIVWNISDSAEYSMRQIAPQQFYADINAPAAVIPAVSRQLVANYDDYFQFFDGTDDSRIDSAYVNSLSADVQLNGNNEMLSANFNKIEVVVTLDPTVILHTNGSTVSETLTYTAWGQTQNFDFTNFKITGLNAVQSKIGIPVNIKIYLTASSSGTTIQSGSTFSLAATFSDFNYSIAYGKFQPAENLTNVTEKFDFNLNAANSLKFINPQIIINVKSKAGVPLNFNIDYLRAYRVDDATFDTIYAQFAPNNARNYTFPVQRAYVPGDWAQTPPQSFDKDNGSTNLLFSQGITPDRLEYKYSVTVSDDKSAPMYITPDALIKIHATAKIPLWLDKGSFYTYSDTVKNVNDGILKFVNEMEDKGITISAASLYMKVINNMPTHGKISYKMLDYNDMELPLDSVTTNTYGLLNFYDIEMPQVDANGRVIAPAEQTIVVGSKTNNILDLLKSVKSIVLTILIDGESKDAIENKVYGQPDNSIRVNLGLYINGKIITTF